MVLVMVLVVVCWCCLGGTFGGGLGGCFWQLPHQDVVDGSRFLRMSCAYLKSLRIIYKLCPSGQNCARQLDTLARPL